MPPVTKAIAQSTSRRQRANASTRAWYYEVNCATVSTESTIANTDHDAPASPNPTNTAVSTDPAPSAAPTQSTLIVALLFVVYRRARYTTVRHRAGVPALRIELSPVPRTQRRSRVGARHDVVRCDERLPRVLRSWIPPRRDTGDTSTACRPPHRASDCEPPSPGDRNARTSVPVDETERRVARSRRTTPRHDPDD
jgi:hypothetical protein